MEEKALPVALRLQPVGLAVAAHWIAHSPVLLEILHPLHLHRAMLVELLSAAGGGEVLAAVELMA